MRPGVLLLSRCGEGVTEHIPKDERPGQDIEAGLHQLLFADMQARITDVSGPGDQRYGKKAEQQLRFRIGVVIPRDTGLHANSSGIHRLATVK